MGRALSGSGGRIRAGGDESSQLPAAQEKFSISYDKGATGCTLKMAWETTQAAVEIK